MYSAEIIAKYFLFKDKNKILFNNNVVENNNRKSYEGNIRLNKYLFLSQVVYLAKYEKKLFNDDFIAYDNGPVVKEIVENYPSMQAKTYDNEVENLPEDIKDFLDKIYESLKNATYQELIEITHEDTAWKEKSDKTYFALVMDLEKYKEKFKKQYREIIKVMSI